MSTDNVTPVPTLSTLGWVTARAQKIDYLLAHAFEADSKQSTLYGSAVTSIQGILGQNSGDIPGSVNALENALTSYLRRYYDNVNVNVLSKLTDPATSESKVTLTVSIFFTENGVESSASYEVTSVNGQTVKFTNLNNS